MTPTICQSCFHPAEEHLQRAHPGTSAGPAPEGAMYAAECRHDGCICTAFAETSRLDRARAIVGTIADEEQALDVIYAMRQRFDLSTSIYTLDDARQRFTEGAEDYPAEEWDVLKVLVANSRSWDEADHGDENYNLLTALEDELTREGLIVYDEERDWYVATEKGREEARSLAPREETSHV